MRSGQGKKDVFRNIYDNNLWGDKDSKSGPGSNFEQTAVIRKLLPGLYKKWKIQSVLDIPCGDFHWMSSIKDDIADVVVSYIGADIVSDVVDLNNRRFKDDMFTFLELDINSSGLPKVDLIFCRDCLVHFSYHDIIRALQAIKKAKAKYILTTSFINKGRRNKNITTGSWRPLNLQKRPFFFPVPEDMIIEGCNENGGIYSDKSLLLWKVKSINLFYMRIYLAFAKLKKGLYG